MKKIILILAIIAITLVAGYWIFQRVYVVGVEGNLNHQISSDEVSQTKRLFTENNLDFTNLEFKKFGIDNFGITHIYVIQFYKNMEIFTNDMTVHFDKTGKLTAIIGDKINEINIDLEPKVSMNQAFSTFKNAMTSQKSFLVFTPSKFTAQLGIYDLSSGVSYTKPNFVLAWKIKPILKDYPVGYINAYNGNVIYFFNGIIIN